jgi:hypothetical protein
MITQIDCFFCFVLRKGDGITFSDKGFLRFDLKDKDKQRVKAKLKKN